MKRSSVFNSKYREGTARVFWIFLLIVVLVPVTILAQEKKITTLLGMTFILVEPGSFIMGSPKTEPFCDADEAQHPETIKRAYYLQTTEVTLKQWRALMGKSWPRQRKGTDDMPVTRVSYYDCLKFIDNLNKMGMGVFRLPTDAEWEYACRAGTTTAYSWGDTIDCSKAMYGNNTNKHDECTLYLKTLKIAPDGPAPVKTFAPNPWGFYDMHGNVWEWCADKYAQDRSLHMNMHYNPMDSDSRIRRGGSWYKYGHYLRSANRTYAHPGAKFSTTGFRLVREVN